MKKLFPNGDYSPWLTNLKFAMVCCLAIFACNVSSQTPSSCCTNIAVNNPGYENSFTKDIRFPDSNSGINARYDTPTSWQYADATNNWEAYHIEDATRASEGSNFVYIPFDEFSPPAANYCIGNYVFEASDGSCSDDYYYNGYRYVFEYDFVAFNRNVPTGGVGSTRPQLEHDYPAILDLYESDGTLASSTDYVSVPWANIGSSWTTVAGVSPALNIGANNFFYFSHYRFGSTGMLIDNTKFYMASIDDSNAANEAVNELGNQITFDLNPNSNIPLGVPNINYTVAAPSGYSVSPTIGEYNTNTSFTLTKNTGTFSPGQIVLLDLEDEVNDVCTSILTVEHPVALPITLTSFESSSKDCITNIHWTAEDASDFGYYLLEYSIDGINFDAIKIIEHDEQKLSTGYTEKFESEFNHKYYRLKMVDLNGSYTYSKIIKGNHSSCKKEQLISAFPNPIRPGSKTTIQFESNRGAANVMITDISGRTILTDEIVTEDGVNEYVPNLEDLPAGSYNVSILSYNNLRTTKIFLIE